MTGIHSKLTKRAPVFMSILQEMGLALKTHQRAFLPFFLVFCFLQMGIFYIMPEQTIRFPIANACLQQKTIEEVTACQERNSGAIVVERTRISKENREKAPFTIILSVLSLLFCSILHYFVSAIYIRRTIKVPPSFSAKEYGHFLSQMLLKYIRPILWNLIPLYGQYMYIRTIIRYEIVAPLTILGCQPEMKTSWDMTEKKEPMIFTLLFVISFVMIALYGVVVYLLSLAPNIIDISTYQKDLYEVWLNLVKSAGIGVMICVYSLFSFSIYKMLSKKQKTDEKEKIESE